MWLPKAQVKQVGARWLTLVVVVSLGAMAAAPRRTVPRAPVDELPSPTGPGARFPSLARATDGRVAMTWIERDADSVPTVKVAVRSAADQWGPVRTVVRDSALFVNFADYAHVVFLPSGELVASWLQRGNGTAKYDYGIRVARSRDGGATWSKPSPPHPAAERGEHGFVSLLPMPGGRVGVSFLNGRDQGQSGGATHVDFAALDGAGTVTAPHTLDERACDCCQTASAITARGPIIAYRDRTSDEIRDIAITRLVGTTWTAPQVVTHDNWKISGCPVNGPALAATGDRVALVWFSAARDSAKVQLAFSSDAGATFGAPVRIDGGQPGGHVDLMLAADGSAYVSWLERTGGEQLDVRVRRVRRDGVALAPTTLGAVTGVRPSGWPAMVAVRDGLLMAWTVPGRPTAIRLARMAVDAR